MRLSRREKKQIREAIRRAAPDNGKPSTVQQSIPFEVMYPDGTCLEREGFYSRTIRFQDINYQLATEDDQKAIFGEWCSFLNSFDSSIRFEMTFVNRLAGEGSSAAVVNIPMKDDQFKETRKEYAGMMQAQAEKGNNGLIRTKYLTFGIRAESLKQARMRLEHVQNDLLAGFRRIGAMAEALSGKERLAIFHDIYHIGDREPFLFDWKWIPATGLSPKDFIAPDSLDFTAGRTFMMGNTCCGASFLLIAAPELSDEMLRDFLDMEEGQVVSMHIRSVDMNEAIRQVKRKITELDRSKIDEQKKAVRAGYDMDVLPSDLVTFGRDAKELLQELQGRNERYFLVTLLFLHTAKTPQALKTTLLRAGSIAQRHNCLLRPLTFRQEQGLAGCLPLADCPVTIDRGLTTSAAAIMVPFTTQELIQRGKEALYYGLNALSGNLIMADRKLLKNPNGLILGTPGSGKSFAAKREITNAFLVTDDDIIVCDPEAEYAPLVERLSGQVIHISPASTDHINPMEVNLNYSEESVYSYRGSGKRAGRICPSFPMKGA